MNEDMMPGSLFGIKWHFIFGNYENVQNFIYFTQYKQINELSRNSNLELKTTHTRTLFPFSKIYQFICSFSIID